jgi:hypothetical protein
VWWGVVDEQSRSLSSGLKELRLSGSMVGQQWDLLAFLPASITYLDLSRTDLAKVAHHHHLLQP